MARIRSVHPGLFTDEAFVQLSDAAQVFFIGLWTEADDQGAFEWKPVTLKMRLRPASITPVEPLLEELEAAGCVKRYAVGGKQYGAVRNFCRFQRPKKPNSIHPVPPEFRTYTASSPSGSELEPDTEPRGSPPTPVEETPVPKKSEIASQMEDGGKEEGKEDTSSLRSDGGKPPGADPNDPRTQLWRDGLATLRTLANLADGPARKLLGRLVDAVGKDHTKLLGLIRRAETEQPDDPVAWITAAAKAKIGGATPLFDETDPDGLRAWISRQQTELETNAATGKREPAINGFLLEHHAYSIITVIDQAGGRAVDRPNWDALAGWCRDDVMLDLPRFLSTIRRVAASLDGPVRSLMVFDAAVREGKAAA